MADKKTTEAVTVKSIDELKAELIEKRTAQLEAKRAHAAGELVNPRVLTSTRKDIARLMTAIRAAEIAAKESK